MKAFANTNPRTLTEAVASPVMAPGSLDWTVRRAKQPMVHCNQGIVRHIIAKCLEHVTKMWSTG